MKLRSAMVKFFTLCLNSPLESGTNIFPHKCLVISKGKLIPMKYNPNQSRAFAEDKGKKDPGKEEEIQKIKMPGFVHPDTQNEEGYFTQKARQQIEELKKRMEKPTAESKEKQE